MRKICNILTIILFIAFGAKTVFDFVKYYLILNSAPFYTWIIANLIYFILPAIIIFTIGRFFKKSK